MNARVVRAKAVVPGDEPPIRDGAIVVDGDGTVIDVGRADQIIPRHAGAPLEHVDGVLLPGLVNAHAHLELSALRGKVPGGRGFVAWLDSFVSVRTLEPPEEDAQAIERAVSQLDLTGTVAVGDVTNTLAAVGALARHGIGGAAFHELFGMDRDKALERIGHMEEKRQAAESFFSADLVYAPAPHTLYTTHPDAVRALLAAARERGARTSLHLAEHPAERSFLVEGTGPYADFARRLGLDVAAFPLSHEGPIDTAARLGMLAPDVLLVHLTDARPKELARVAASGAPVVVCPRSNLFIEVRLPPLADMLREGIVPALGTDSLASNTSLDLLAEARALGDRFPSVPARELLRMATAAGARALARADLGRLGKGARPGVLAISGVLGESDDPCAWVLRQPITARRWVVRRSALPASAGNARRAQS
jgi:cytosine/adenosine deaminase-related metal-dependent hydrolase